MTFNITPSGRIDYCSQCKQEHGYDCPLDTQPNQPDSVAKLATDLQEKLFNIPPVNFNTRLNLQYQLLVDAITQAKAEERERAVEVVEGLRKLYMTKDTDFSNEHGTNVADVYNQALDDTIKALQDNQPLP